MFITIVIIIVVIYLIVRYIKKSNSSQSSPANAKLNINNDEFEIRDGVLHAYKGNSDVVIVPKGVTAIYTSDEKPVVLSRKKRVVLPRSLLYIGKNAIRCVEEICYRGSEAEWRNIGIINDEANADVGIVDSWRDVTGGPLIKTRYRYNWVE